MIRAIGLTLAVLFVACVAGMLTACVSRVPPWLPAAQTDTAMDISSLLDAGDGAK